LTSPQQNREAEKLKLVWIPDVQQSFDVPLPDEFWKVRTRVIDRLGVRHLPEDAYKGSYLSLVTAGGAIHRHRDTRLKIDGEEYLILRCNVLFARPELGGMPVIGHTEVDVPDRGMWAFFPTEVLHAATKVAGSAGRGLLSFGFLVRFADLHQRGFNVSSQVLAESRALSREPLVEQLRASGLSEWRVELFCFVLEHKDGFTVEKEVVASIDCEPLEVLGAIYDLHRNGVITSHSSARVDRGRTLVF
jgi:hypothetical protein